MDSSAGACPACHPPSPAIDPAASGPAQLIVEEPGRAARVMVLANPPITIGRDPSCQIQIGNSAVSRKHAQVELQGPEYWISDLGSKNGTHVNGHPLRQSARLSDGDTIRIGDQQGNSVGLTFQNSAGESPRGQRFTSPSLEREFCLGRDPSCSMCLDHPGVSRRHAQVESTPRGRWIRDLHSRNGTFVNGDPLRGAHLLQAGDVVQIGPFKLIYDSAGFSHAAPLGSYRLDAVRLRLEVQTQSGSKKLILKDVSLSIFPKEFVALVGGSGAGKSTLMKALSGFAPAQGRVLVNGDDLYEHYGAYRSIIGYVPQDDIIHGQLTVASALLYAARLRLPDAGPEEIDSRISEVLAQVEMSEHLDKPVNRLSGGQRKRVSIAVELLAEPGLFFLDEPTSGLDPGLEKKMMYTMRQLADEGRTIVLVTHATDNITQCTHVAFMAKGHLAYFGPPQQAMAFFGASDFADIYSRLTQPIDPVRNPLPQHLEPLHQEMRAAAPRHQPSTAEVWARCFRASPQYSHYVVDRLHGAESTGAHPLGGGAAGRATRQRVSALDQFLVLTRRYLDLVLRDALTLIILVAVMPIIGLMLTVIVGKEDLTGKSAAAVKAEIQQAIADKSSHQDPAKSDETFEASYEVASSAQRLLFMLALAASLLGVFAAGQEIVKEEAIYQRERMVNLGIGPYLLSKMVVLAVFALAQCGLLLLVLGLKVDYPAAGVLMPLPLELFLTLFLAVLASLNLGLLISAVVRSSTAVIYVILVTLFVQIIFAGALFDLPPAARPLSYLTTTRWTLEALGSSVNMDALSRLGVTCIEFEDSNFRRGLGTPKEPCQDGQMRQSLETSFHVDYKHEADHLLRRWLALLAFAFGFGGLAYLAQRRKDLV